MFEWKDKYSVGIESIDGQHKKLLAIGTKLVNVLENTSAGLDQYDQIKEVLKEMYDYTVYHFNSEEEVLEKYNYIDLPTQRFQHKMFIKKLEDIDLDTLDQDQKTATLELLDFISNWISNHILQEDHKYEAFLKENGVV